MMVLSALRPDASLTEFLAYRARSAPVARLAAEAMAGAVILAAALWWNPPLQLVITTAATCFLCYSIWGLLDRARSKLATRDLPATTRAFSILCHVCAGIGLLAGAGVLLSIWALALGTWIS